MDLKLSRYLVVTDPIPGHLNGRPKRLLLGTRTNKIVEMDVEWWEALGAGKFADLPLPLLEKLKDARLIVDSQENELANVLKENRSAVAEAGRLFLAIQPTAACQLTCDYCGQFHRPHKLSDEDQGRLAQRVRDRLGGGRYRELKVAWYGGEPLLAMDIIRKLAPGLQTAAKEGGCAYISEMVTNGLLLTPEIAAELSREHGVGMINITLDGADLDHDRRRIGKNGAPTFKRIFNNVVGLARRDDLEVKIIIRCNVDHRNRDGVPRLIQMLADYGIHDRIERLYMVPVHPWVNDHTEEPVSPEEFARWEVPWLVQMTRLGFKNIDLIPARLKIVCFAVEPEAEDVDAYGNLFNCSEFSFVPEYEQPAVARGIVGGPSNLHAIGTLAGGEEPGKRALMGKFYDRIERGELPCHGCEILPLCGGACPKFWHIGLAPCLPLKFNISQRLEANYHLTRVNYSPLAWARNFNFQNCLKEKN